DHDVVAAGGEVHRAAVERADLGHQRAYVVEALGGNSHVGAVRIDRQHLLVAAQHQIATHSCGEVEDDVDARGPDPLDGLGVELGRPRTLAGLRVAHVNVRDRGSCLGRLDGRVGDLLGRDGDVRALAHRVAGPGDCAGDEDFPVHGDTPCTRRGDLVV